MKNSQKVFLVSTAIVLGTCITWYLQVYKNRVVPKKTSGMVVTIPPIRFIVNKIVGDDFPITTLLPEGASPETYEPTPKQILSASDADIIFATGLLDFEKTLVGKIESNSNTAISILSDNIPLKEGDHSDIPSTDELRHHHGVDPHIWTSLRCLKIMTDNAYNSIKSIYPDSTKYYDNYLKLITEIESADSVVSDIIAKSGMKYFLIYHPALTYYSNDYKVEQIALEQDGKEPTANHMKTVIAQAKQDSVKTILYQKQLTQSVVMTVAKDIGAEPVAFDPLSEDVIRNILWVTETTFRQ